MTTAAAVGSASLGSKPRPSSSGICMAGRKPGSAAVYQAYGPDDCGYVFPSGKYTSVRQQLATGSWVVIPTRRTPGIAVRRSARRCEKAARAVSLP